MPVSPLSSFIVHRSSFRRVSSIIRYSSLVILLTVFACSRDTAATSPATAPSATQSAAASRRLEESPFPVKFDSTTFDIKGKPFTIELAESDLQVERGLMYRDSMPADHGMLFVFAAPDTYSFWMHNTRIPLDIIYLDKNARVLEIHNRKPFDDTGMAPRNPALFVIELNAGTAKTLGLQPGDTIALPQKYLKAAPASTDK